METDQGMITEQDAIMKHLVQFYKELFGPVDSRNIFLSNSFWESSRKVNAKDRENLIKLFTEEKIKQSIFDMKKDAAPGPNGFGATLFQTFWNLIKGRYCNMFLDFYKGELDIKRINFGVITLVPKVQEANNIRQYRPICLLNVDYEGFTKVLTERLTPVAKAVIGEN
jgi:hypothetical protein